MTTDITHATPAAIQRIQTPAEAWYQSLVDDCRGIITEAIHNSRWDLIVGYHELGERIVEDTDYQRYSNGNGKLLSCMSESIGTSERDLYRAMQFYRLYPDLDKVPDGKNISWYKIVNKYLPEPKENGRHIPSVTIDIAFERYKKDALYIYENYPDWFDAMLQYMMDLRKDMI
jgi:hypothetical protein